MIPEQGHYPWAVWGEADEILIVTALPPRDWQSLEFSDEGPPIAIEPYGKVSFELMVDGMAIFTPWIHITVSPMVIPVPKEFTGKYEVFQSAAPGQTLTFEVSEVKDLDKPPKKKQKNKKK